MNTTSLSFWKCLACALATLMLTVVTQAQPAAAQDSEPSAQDKAMHYSLYYEDFKNESYQSALPNLQWILENAPTYPRNDDRNFERATELYAGLAEQAEDEETARAYLDSALVIFNTAVEKLKAADAEVDEFEWTRDKGRFIQSHADLLGDLQEEAIEAYKQAWELDPSRMQSYYINLIITHYVERMSDKQSAIDFIDDVETKRGDDEEVMQMITDWRGQLFTSPEERYDFVKSQLEDNPEDVALLREKLDLERELGHRAEMFQTAERLLGVDPTAENYYEVGSMYLDDAEPQEAFSYFEQAIEAEGITDELKRDIYYDMGLAQRQMEQLSKARTYFRRALDVDPNFGRAYIAIGDLYAMAVAQCSTEMDREDRAVYWLVVDYYNRARSVDPSVASTANQKAGTYRQYYPTQEALFFNNWKAGDSYRVDYGCYSWINEATTVKAPS